MKDKRRQKTKQETKYKFDAVKNKIKLRVLGGQSAFFVVRGEDLPRATFAKTIESIVEPLLFSPAHFPAQGTSSAVWLGGSIRHHQGVSEQSFSFQHLQYLVGYNDVTYV